ncbi:hypothetical protein [Dactylosporangium sp. CA-092794]|uniref:hypothetical protein n=1 Tax=Dactylosporangium sp. CA-092794 TaxID=3239929 RepID=UPI003D8D972E
MSRDELDLDSIEPETVVPQAPARAALWAAGIGGCAVFVLFLLLTSDLVFGRSVTLGMPERIGDWSAATSVLPGDPGDGLGAEQGYAAVYLTDDGNAALVLWGGTGGRIGPARAASVLATLRDGTLVFVPGTAGHDKTVGATADADPGTHGGLAACTPVRYDEERYTVCAWTGRQAALGMLFRPAPPDPGTALRTVLDAVVLVS